MNQDIFHVKEALKRNGFASLSDLFISHPTFDFYRAADYLNKGTKLIAPIDLEKTLREECQLRGDFHFFARIALFTALNALDGMGWTERRYLLYGIWTTILGDDHEKFASRCWDFLKRRLVMNGWKPQSIFDPILEEALAEAARSTIL